jgi:NAD(P)H-dependent FMN reductase
LQALPGTSSAILEERFNEDELREILTWMEAPVNRKFGTALGETQKRLAEKVVPEAGPTLEARFRALQTSVAKLLGLPPPGAARPANAPPPAPPAPASAAQPKK